jgi:transcriptional regulator with XRE-family HTH domain
MRFSEAFRETMFRFKLKGIEIAKQSQLTPNQISTFQNGGNLRIDSVEKILEALPKPAKKYMLSLVAQDESLIGLMPDGEEEELED